MIPKTGRKIRERNIQYKKEKKQVNRLIIRW